ncbi:TetR/AcrR family transcriptional regulator [Puniceibacterium sediminis]|uniref:Transcriptional regulator, TetR family n=1 Tax=Puniceibacterium sediminis TaxID=1608407 RepID=A0A238W9G2_9RHOB|nr:TetR/AcrR family transcriptional regulator [Puniceibacterium sediminis]SNR42924.1 transcriptional regulator, TetR family [Puniceibacterium sediminis]
MSKAEISEAVDHEDVPRRSWKQDPDGVRANILQVAREAFAQKGLSGTRIDEIAARTSTSKRMIYYYFGDKEGLYLEVLADAYRRTREAEDALELEGLQPEEALRKIAEFTFDNHRRSQDFIRLVMIENVHEARHMPGSVEMSGENSSAIRMLEDIYARGLEAGIFRPGLSAVELHWHISALSYFNVSNRATFSHIFGDELFSEEGQNTLRRHVGDMILRLVLV